MVKMRYIAYILNGTTFYVTSVLVNEVAELETATKRFTIRGKARYEMMNVGLMHLCDYAVRDNVLLKGHFNIHQLIQGSQADGVVDNTITIKF